MVRWGGEVGALVPAWSPMRACMAAYTPCERVCGHASAYACVCVRVRVWVV